MHRPTTWIYITHVDILIDRLQSIPFNWAGVFPDENIPNWRFNFLTYTKLILVITDIVLLNLLCNNTGRLANWEMLVNNEILLSQRRWGFDLLMVCTLPSKLYYQLLLKRPVFDKCFWAYFVLFPVRQMKSIRNLVWFALGYFFLNSIFTTSLQSKIELMPLADH